MLRNDKSEILDGAFARLECLISDSLEDLDESNLKPLSVNFKYVEQRKNMHTFYTIQCECSLFICHKPAVLLVKKKPQGIIKENLNEHTRDYILNQQREISLKLQLILESKKLK